MQRSWEEKLKFNGNYSEHKQKFKEMLSEFAKLRYRILCTIHTVKHCIDLGRLDVLSIRRAPYRAGPKKG